MGAVLEFVEEDAAIPDPTCLDPYEGGERPGEPFDPTQLPPVAALQRRKFFAWEFTTYNCGHIFADVRFDAKSARTYLEEQIARLSRTLRRARFHAPKDCYFVFPMDRKKEQ